MTTVTCVDTYAGPGRLLHLEGGAVATPVLMTHGTFSTAETLLPLARFLLPTRPVYILEWRGRGRRPGAFNFHDLADGEVTAALACLPEPAHLVAHSGGGLAMALAMVAPENRARARSLTLIATQATHLPEAPPLNYLGVRLMELLGRLLGYWPARLTGLGPSNETACLLSQWVRFNRTGGAHMRDGAPLAKALGLLNLPVLALAGAADLTIARPDGCRDLARAFGSTAQYHLCDARSDGEDFTHARLIRSRAAKETVWPRIARFHSACDALHSGPVSG